MLEIRRETWKRCFNYNAVGVCCCLEICNSVVNIVVTGLVLGQSFISSTGILLYLPFIMYYGSVFVVYRQLHCL